MKYYIDGYNLLFRLGGPVDISLQTQRQKLIAILNDYVQLLGLNVTLVFDSPRTPERKRTHYHNLEIIYTSVHETADEFIIEELSEAHNPKKIVVITSDKFLALQAKKLRARTDTVEHFADWIETRVKNKLQPKPKKEALILPNKPRVLPPLEEKIKPPIEGTEAYYLRAFEEEYQKIISSEKKPPEQKKPKKVRKPPKYEPKAADPIHDQERWLKIFESRLKSD